MSEDKQSGVGAGFKPARPVERDIVRGAQAQALLQNELLQESFARLEADYIAAWRITPARDTDARERLWQAVNVLGKVREHLHRVAADGKLAQRQLDELVARDKHKGR